MLGISKISDNVDTFEVKDSGYVLTGSVHGYRNEYFFFFFMQIQRALVHITTTLVATMNTTVPKQRTVSC